MYDLATGCFTYFLKRNTLEVLVFNGHGLLESHVSVFTQDPAAAFDKSIQQIAHTLYIIIQNISKTGLWCVAIRLGVIQNPNL